MTNIFIESWRSVGLRCPDHEVHLAGPDGAIWPVTFIQMPNGTGKTTTLRLLRLAFSGMTDWAELSAPSVRAYAKNGNDRGRGEFHVTVRYDGGNRLTLTLKFDFEDGTVRPETTLPTGLRSGFHPPSSLRRFFAPELVDFFVFDGELAEHLLDSQKTDARRVIDALFQLNLFERIGFAVEAHWEERTKDAGAKEERGLARRQSRVQALKKRIRDLSDERRDLLGARAKAAQEAERLGKKYAEDLSQQKELGKAFASKRVELARVLGEAKTLRQQVLNAMRSPDALSAEFARELVALKGSLDRLKLPESTAREFFEELAEEAECVCGRALDDETRAAVRARAGQYLGTDDSALLNAMKADINARLAGAVGTSCDALSEKLKELERLIRLTLEVRVDLNEIKERAQALDPALAQVQERQDEFEAKVQKCDDRLKDFEDPSDIARDEATGIAVLKRRLRDAERQLGEITDTLELKGKRDALLRVLREARDASQRALASLVVDETNRRISEVLPDNAIRLSAVGASLHLDGKSGGSTGETLTVGYAFLSTIFNRAGRRLPFVVDSPANPIDLAVRPRIGALLPQLTHQLVAFTISPEREAFVPYVEGSAGGTVQHLTLFRRGNAELEAMAVASGASQVTVDGVLVSGRPFFLSFQMDQEGE